MSKTPHAVIKNHIYLASFDAVGQEAANLVTAEKIADDNGEPWLFIALVSLSTTDIDEVVDWLKPIQTMARLAKEPMLLAIHISPLIVTKPQERVDFLRSFSKLAGSVVLMSQLDGDTPAQSLARLPQLFVNVLFRPGMINIDLQDLKDEQRSGVAFFGYGLQQTSDDMNAPLEEIFQQCRGCCLPSADVKTMLVCIDGHEDIGLVEYMTLNEKLRQTHDIFRPVKNVSLAIGISVKPDIKHDGTHIGVLFFGLDFYESVIY